MTQQLHDMVKWKLYIVERESKKPEACGKVESRERKKQMTGYGQDYL